MAITISNALPVQYWAIDEDTYTEKDVCGITPICFCQPFECNDIIPNQFTDTVQGNEYTLIIVDEDDNEQYIPFDSDDIFVDEEFSKAVLSADLIPSELDLCNNQIRLYIAGTVETIEETDFLIYEFPSDMEGWTSVTTPAFAWSSDNSGSLITTMTGAQLPTVKNINVNISPNQPFTIRIIWTSSVFSGPAPIKLGFYIYDAGGITLLQNNTFSDAGGVNTSLITVSSPSVYNNAAEFLIQMFRDVSGGSFVIHINSVEVLITETITTYTRLYKSDCLSIKQTHPCTKGANYSNFTNFSGLIYGLTSPLNSFTFRFPAIFFHETNTSEQEDIELSDENIVRLYNKLEEKRLLQIGHMPHYMHRKLQMILMHDTVIIDEKSWLRRDEYQLGEGNRHYPLKPATVLLIDKNFIKENQL